MTRKDYELIAAALRRSQPSLALPLKEGVAAQGAWSRVVEEVAVTLFASNPNFNSDRFIDACTGRKA